MVGMAALSMLHLLLPLLCDAADGLARLDSTLYSGASRKTYLCMQVLGSERLQAALGAALAAGNAVNAGTSVGGTLGVRVDSLARLCDFRVCHMSLSAGAVPGHNL